MIQQQGHDVDSEPIVITYNSTASVTNLSNISRTSAEGNTDFVKGYKLYF